MCAGIKPCNIVILYAKNVLHKYELARPLLIDNNNFDSRGVLIDILDGGCATMDAMCDR